MEKEFYAKGKRSIVYKAKLEGKIVIVKEERKDIDAIERANNEIKWIKKLNKYGIGPKLLGEGKDYFICEFVKGKRILEFVENAEAGKIRDQCRTMDRLLVSKEEMHHPVKHIIVGKKVTMIDFERCHNTERPKNVTQFCQFLMSKNVTDLIKGKGIILDKEKIRITVKGYKKSYSETDFNKIKKLIS
jgi:putative serine/threonine protein kinase